MSDRRQVLQEALAAIERLESRLAASEGAKHEPLAIVGAGCRYPGGIEDPEGLWNLVRRGVDAVVEVPPDRWDADAYYSPDPKAPGKMITRRGGFLPRVDLFDPQFFGISPREATTMDPQQRFLLEAAQEALESAAIAPDRLVGSSTGVFVGITTSDYAQLLRLGGPEHSDVYAATGGALNAAAGRIAYTFGLQGPCVSVDTACSSSLVAVHLACQSLRAGESDLALAGGVNVVLSPDAMVLFSKWGMMAPDGACKTFDAAADGFVRAEGCAVIALKRLSDALAARDPILAVIRGSAVNSDGRSSGLTVPNGLAQQAVIRKALANAGLEPADVDYVEAHGTGTSLGDPIEVEALGAVMRQGRPPERPLLVGSVKTNIGHAEAASGVAGLLKVVMSLRHEAIPPHLHFSRPNPRIPWGELPIAVPTVLTPWPRSARARRAGVSAFGFSGTNAHVLLEEAPPPPVARPATPGTPFVVPLSARDEVALREVARRTADFVAANPDATLGDVAMAAGTGRAHHVRRLAVVADSTSDLARDLRSWAEGQATPSAAEGAIRPGERPKIAFLFTGQGAQYAGMGRGLYDHEPVFRAALDRAAAILAPHLGRPLLDVLFPADGEPTPLGETAFTQPALFAVEYALAELWRSWGVTPSIVAGHSVGEYVAACVAGVMSLEDGLGLIAERGRLMQALPQGGGMAAVFADEASVAARIARFPDRLAVAGVNGPEETVISGDLAALAEVLAGCAADGITARPLEVSHAFHSPSSGAPAPSAWPPRASRSSRTSPAARSRPAPPPTLATGAATRASRSGSRRASTRFAPPGPPRSWRLVHTRRCSPSRRAPRPRPAGPPWRPSGGGAPTGGRCARRSPPSSSGGPPSPGRA
jgi:acyl transferase domain-containing protein